ncbi:M23 family metallopeptidase [uncultured Sphingomonas sp.]|uniref:M23 family metallopeptidase n=1 Tax=uncultured Sphingomonas sp. TaxID=158754 RepID=UPI0035CA9077
MRKRLGLAIGGSVVAGVAILSVTTVRFEPASDARPMSFAEMPPRPIAISSPSMGELVIPVAGVARAAIRDSWGDARSGGRGHRGLDVMAAEGTPVVAAVAGRVEKLFDSELGGTTLYLRSADGRWQYYYAHLKGYAGGVREGMKVRAGEVLGYVGDTGDAGKGNHHLHFSTSRMKPGDRWWQGDDVNPYPLLAEGEGRR